MWSMPQIQESERLSDETPAIKDTKSHSIKKKRREHGSTTTENNVDKTKGLDNTASLNKRVREGEPGIFLQNR